MAAGQQHGTANAKQRTPAADSPERQKAQDGTQDCCRCGLPCHLKKTGAVASTAADSVAWVEVGAPPASLRTCLQKDRHGSQHCGDVAVVVRCRRRRCGVVPKVLGGLLPLLCGGIAHSRGSGLDPVWALRPVSAKLCITRGEAFAAVGALRAHRGLNRGPDVMSCGAGRMVCTAAVHRLQHHALWRGQLTNRLGSYEHCRPSAHGKSTVNFAKALSHPADL